MQKVQLTTGEALVLLIIGIPLSALTSYYMAYCETKIVLWYSIPLAFSIKQWFGINAIFGFILLSCKKDNDKGFDKLMGSIFSTAFVLTFMLGLLYIISTII